MARLGYVLMDVLDDDSSEARTTGIQLLDASCAQGEAGVVVVEASDADVDSRLYRPDTAQRADPGLRGGRANGVPHGRLPTAWAPSRTRAGGLRDGAALQAGARAGGLAAPLTKDADTLRRQAARPDAVDAVTAGLCYVSDRPRLVLLPCGHSGRLRAPSRTSRARAAPAAAAPSTRSWSTTRRRGRTRTGTQRSASWARAPHGGAGRRRYGAGMTAAGAVAPDGLTHRGAAPARHGRAGPPDNATAPTPSARRSSPGPAVARA